MGLEAASRARSRASFAAPARSRPARPGRPAALLLGLETDPFPGARGDYLKTLGERFGQPTLEGDDRIFRAGEHAVRVKVHEDRIAVHVGTATR